MYKSTNIGSDKGQMIVHDYYAHSQQPPDSGGRLNIKMSSYQYRDSPFKDKMVLWPSYL